MTGDREHVGRLRRGLGRALREAEQALAQRVAPAQKPPDALAREADLPVVARVVIEVRSDGSQTIARGALEATGAEQERVAIEARGTTPALLAASLARAIAEGLILGSGEGGKAGSVLRGIKLFGKTR
jgi:hypothetical protein